MGKKKCDGEKANIKFYQKEAAATYSIYTSGRLVTLTSKAPTELLEAAPAATCQDEDVKTASGDVPQEGVAFDPRVFYNGTFYPICGHHFWDNNEGASTICRKLGFKK